MGWIPFNDGIEPSNGIAGTLGNIVTYNLDYWTGDNGNAISPTVANIQNNFVHEAGGHFFNKLYSDGDATQKGVLNHIKVYELQMAHSSWMKTTEYYKAYMQNNLQKLQKLW